ncbi:MAG: MalY/PatB family protein [Pseudomonadales bacterium]
MTRTPPPPTADDPARHWQTPLNRLGTAATKWEKFGPDVLPFWIADMELPTPDAILNGIGERLEHPLLGYTNVPAPLIEAFTNWAQRLFGWSIDPDWLVWIPGVVPGLNVAAQSIAQANDPVFVMPPVYYPFLDVAANANARSVTVPLQAPDWRLDSRALAAAAQANACKQPRPRAMLLCNPQNPTGRAYDHAELNALAQTCADHDLIICSDEIHCDLLVSPSARHIPIASLDADTAQRTITLMAPTKTYNMPGLGCAVAVIPNPVLRNAFRDSRRGVLASPSVLAYAAATAAYEQDGRWIEALREHLRANYAALAAVAGARLTRLEATYLGWIAVPELAQADAQAHFLKFGLGLSDGRDFGGPGYVRFNFACARPLLDAGLARLQEGLRALPQG